MPKQRAQCSATATHYIVDLPNQLSLLLIAIITVNCSCQQYTAPERWRLSGSGQELRSSELCCAALCAVSCEKTDKS